MVKTLVIYYSRSGENYTASGIRNLEKGNTEMVVEFIREACGADLFKLETVKEYPADYHACTEEAKREQWDNARPELKKSLDDISSYENIVVAGPCWWGTYPMAVLTELERLKGQFDGKKVFAVMTHEGSGLGSGGRLLKRLCKGASFGEGLAIRGSEAAGSRAAVAAWAKRCGL